MLRTNSVSLKADEVITADREIDDIRKNHKNINDITLILPQVYLSI